MNQDYLLENKRERERLQALIERLSDEEFGYPIENGWSVAATLVHLAFWDQQRRALLVKWQQTGVAPGNVDTDSINEALLHLADALPPRTAARLALTAAETVDRTLEQISPDMAGAIEASGQSRVLRRALHRGEHLDEIERALRTHARHP
jgi:hypothetical protein